MQPGANESVFMVVTVGAWLNPRIVCNPLLQALVSMMRCDAGTVPLVYAWYGPIDGPDTSGGGAGGDGSGPQLPNVPVLEVQPLASDPPQPSDWQHHNGQFEPALQPCQAGSLSHVQSVRRLPAEVHDDPRIRILSTMNVSETGERTQPRRRGAGSASAVVVEVRWDGVTCTKDF